MALFPRSEEDKKRRAAERKRKFEERKAAMEKKQREVREGRAAGMTMTEIRAKRMNISAAELKKRQLATILGMAEGMSIFLPAGAAIKAGQLVYRGLKGAKAAKALKDAAAAGAKLKKAGEVKKATRGDKPKPSGSTPKLEQKPRVIPKPGTAVARVTRSGAAAKRMPEKKMKRATVTSDKPSTTRPTPKPTPKPRSTTKPTPKPNRRLTTRDKILGGAAAAGVVAAVGNLGKDKKTEASPSRSSGPSTRGSRRPPSADKPRPTSGPSTRGSRRPPSADKAPARKPSGPQTRGSQKRGATNIITAGPNTGFGPKGNQFPKDAADRRRLMAMYGGTGSAAAKAAAAGKQGNLKKKKSS